jgi:predicted RNA binding protein YcfA (HicA-like mRNA interferase family)
VTVINWLESDDHQLVNGVGSHDQMSPAPQD